MNTIDQIDSTTPFGFWDSFFKSFSIIFFSEIADKTFILLLFFSLKISKWKLLIVASAALVGMNVIAVLVGYSLPLLLYRGILNWIAMFSFAGVGVYLLYKAYEKPKKTVKEKFEKFKKKKEYKSELEINLIVEDHEHQHETHDHRSEHSRQRPSSANENSLLLGVFGGMIVAECGDRSQITSVAISAIYEFYGTLLGSSLAHIACSFIAIFLGKALAEYLSEKQMMYIGAVMFFIFSFELLLTIMGYSVI